MPLFALCGCRKAVYQRTESCAVGAPKDLRKVHDASRRRARVNVSGPILKVMAADSSGSEKPHRLSTSRNCNELVPETHCLLQLLDRKTHGRRRSGSPTASSHYSAKSASQHLSLGWRRGRAGLLCRRTVVVAKILGRVEYDCAHLLDVQISIS